MEKELEIQEIRGVIRRRKKAFILSFLLILLIGVNIALLLPPIYTSKAMIRIEDQEIPENFVKSTITDYAEERLEKINQQILSRPKLLEIIDEFNLYPDSRDKKDPTELVAKMRNDIGLKKISLLGNKIRSEKDRDFLVSNMPVFQFLGFIPFRGDIIEADLEGLPPFEKDQEGLEAVKGMIENLE